MRRTDLEGLDLKAHRERIAVLRGMTPEQKIQETFRLTEEKRVAERAYRESLFALPMVSQAVGRMVRLMPKRP